MRTPKQFFWIGSILMFIGIWCTGVEATPALVKTKKCDTCHRFSKGEARKSAPDLFFAGDKFQREWLESYLKQPEVIRLAGHTNDPGFLKGTPQYTGPHPSLNPKEARQMTDHLMSLKILKNNPPLELPALSKGARVRVKILFERDYSCIACHQSYNLARQPRGGVSGPSLIDAGNRLRPEWVYQWLKNPRQFNLKGKMPLFSFDDETLKKMTQYITFHKKDLKNQ